MLRFQIPNIFSSFRRDERGGIAILSALAITALMGMSALSIEAGLWYKEKKVLQTASDAGAYAAISQKREGASDAEIEQIILDELAENGIVEDDITSIEINTPPENGDYIGDNNAIEVIVTRTPSLMLSNMFINNVEISSRSVSMITTQTVSGSDACILALDNSASQAVRMWGSLVIDLEGCVIASNSSAADAIAFGGNSDVSAESAYTVGGVSSGGSASQDFDDDPVEGGSVVEDPYEDYNVGTLGSCTGQSASYGNGTHNLTPGVFCAGLSLTSKAKLTLAPGTYYVVGNFTMHGQAQLTGDGVTIVMASKTGTGADVGTVTVNGGATINLRAPDADDNQPYTGIAWMQDRRAGTSGLNKFEGGSTMNIDGAIYFPQQQLRFRGNSGLASSDCSQLIGRTIDMSGNSSMTSDGCDALGARPIETTTTAIVADLVE